MRGSGVSTASSADAMAASGSYSPTIRSSAAVAISSLLAATAATGSPTNRTLSSARACSSWLTGRMPKGIGRSRPVSTACTPSSARARETSMRRMRACGWVERSTLANSMRGRNRSSANLVTPVTFAVASTLRNAFPMRRKDGRTEGATMAGSCIPFPSFRLSVAFLLPAAIERLRCRLCRLTSQASRGQFDGLVDLDVAGAAAQVARERRLDLPAVRSRVVAQQRKGGEQERRGAVAALRRAQLGERVLQRVQLPARGHPLDGLHSAPSARLAEHEAGQHGPVVQQHGAGAAFAQLATVLRSGEAEVLAQHFEQRLVGGKRDLGRLAVEVERDLDLGHTRNLTALAPRQCSGIIRGIHGPSSDRRAAADTGSLGRSSSPPDRPSARIPR